ncbi:MAG: hypothetical protein P4M09_06340 [Devosia sp.]|nr:hypothetical protein [Devosia sp.]
MPFRYVPILKTKSGEAVALENLSPTQKDRVMPLFCVGETVPSTFAAKAAAAWAGRRLALDGVFHCNFTGSVAHYNSLFSNLVGLGIPVIPSIEFGAPAIYAAAVQAKVNQSGLVLRVPIGSLPNALSYAAQSGWSTSAIDLVVQLGHIGEFDPAMLGAAVNGFLPGHLQPGTWRSVALSSSAAPKDFGGLSPSVNIIPRRDWALWLQVNQAVCPIDFSDYAQSHLDLTDPPGVAMAKATVSVRYAAVDHWVMIKGRPTTGHTGLAMSTQYRGHATSLISRPEFQQGVTSWGDSRISAIAAGTSTPGGRTQWVEIGTNRHLSVVSSTLP